jgi:ABC-type multidrug transport system ATPase subunit
MATKNSLVFESLRQDVKCPKSDSNPEGYKTIVDDISGGVYSGETLAILGPSGAGKTSLLNVLTLNATSPGANCYGKCLLNGKKMDQSMFVKHACFVEQLDSHRAFLTCAETISYALDFYATPGQDKEKLTRDLLDKLGLSVCKDTKVGNQFIQGLSGGQKKRLSLALALIKKPEIMYLDEPTSGLDAAASANVMQYVKELTKEYNIITVATIHQPSSNIYFSFDYAMLLSRGRLAYFGTPKNSIPYFKTIGYDMPEFSNPADFLLDCINAEFTSPEKVNEVLDAWSANVGGNSSKYGVDTNAMLSATSGTVVVASTDSNNSWFTEFGYLCKRQTYLACIDPMIYLGRAVGFLNACIFFAVIYVESRDRVQEQVLNRLWLSMWLCGVPTSFGVVAVFAFSEEFKSINKEVKNGMYRLSGYLTAAGLLQIPAMIILALCVTGIPAFAIGNMWAPNFVQIVAIYAVTLFGYECIARCFSVQFADPLIGMLAYMNTWFTSFVFAGVMIPEEQVIWPFRIFVYVLPLNWGIQTISYLDAIDAKYGDAWTCTSTSRTDCLFHYGEDGTRRYPGWTCSETENGGYNPLQCYGREGWQVLDSLGMNYGSITSTNYLGRNFGIIMAIAFAMWVVYIFAAYAVTMNVSSISDTTPPPSHVPELNVSVSKSPIKSGAAENQVAIEDEEKLPMNKL